MMNSDHVMYFSNLISEAKVKWQRVYEVMAVRIFLPVKDQTEWRWPAISRFLLTTSNFPYRILNFNSPPQQVHSENISVSQAQLRWASFDLHEHEKTGHTAVLTLNMVAALAALNCGAQHFKWSDLGPPAELKQISAISREKQVLVLPQPKRRTRVSCHEPQTAFVQ